MRRAAPAFIFVSIILGNASAYSKDALYGTPVYFKPTDTYYELVSFSKQYHFPGGAGEWGRAAGFARKRIHKGRHGRLAVVPSKEVNDFLRKTFQPDTPTWIGLRYFCKYGKFAWVNGETLGRNDYQNFGLIWNILGVGDGRLRTSNAGCALGYWPVHYWAVSGPYAKGFYWNANGGGKNFRAFFVEYPPPASGKDSGQSN